MKWWERLLSLLGLGGLLPSLRRKALPAPEESFADEKTPIRPSQVPTLKTPLAAVPVKKDGPSGPDVN